MTRKSSKHFSFLFKKFKIKQKMTNLSHKLFSIQEDHWDDRNREQMHPIDPVASDPNMGHCSYRLR